MAPEKGCPLQNAHLRGGTRSGGAGKGFEARPTQSPWLAKDLFSKMHFFFPCQGYYSF